MSRTAALEIIEPGLASTIQDLPGRIGHRHEGFSESGPMDSFAFRAANLLVGNPITAPAIEVPMSRIQLATLCPCTVAVTGPPEMEVTIDGEAVTSWRSVRVDAGQEIGVRLTGGAGFRCYLAIRGGLDVPAVLDSRSTSLITRLGGMGGGLLADGDLLYLPDLPEHSIDLWLPTTSRPLFHEDWEIEVIRGPQADPEFLTGDDWRMFLSATWRVDLRSNRAGVRLSGPPPFQWARRDGGLAGGHPSNVLDCPYPIGGVNINGDHPVIIGPDGPTAGGFVVIATVPTGALWKLGQLRPGRDSIRFREINDAQAAGLRSDLRARLARIEPISMPV